MYRRGETSAVARALRVLDGLRGFKLGRPLAELADELGVSEKTIRRDLVDLSDAGFDDRSRPRRQPRRRPPRRAHHQQRRDHPPRALHPARHPQHVRRPPRHPTLGGRRQRPAQARAAHEPRGARRARHLRRPLRLRPRRRHQGLRGQGGRPRRAPHRRPVAQGRPLRLPGRPRPHPAQPPRPVRHAPLQARPLRRRPPPPRPEDGRAIPPGGIAVFAVERFTDAESLRGAPFTPPADFQLTAVMHGAFGIHLGDPASAQDVVIEFSQAKAPYVRARTLAPRPAPRGPPRRPRPPHLPLRQSHACRLVGARMGPPRASRRAPVANVGGRCRAGLGSRAVSPVAWLQMARRGRP